MTKRLNDYMLMLTKLNAMLTPDSHLQLTGSKRSSGGRKENQDTTHESMSNSPAQATPKTTGTNLRIRGAVLSRANWRGF